MLNHAAEKIAAEHFTDYVTLLWANGANLPVADASFDLVSCMEALEFMPDPEKALTEVIRPLRPGGLLLTTRRINTYMPGRLWEQDDMRVLLEEEGITGITFQTWHTDYELVWGHKMGESSYIGAQPPENLLICPNCEHQAYQINDTGWHCQHCGKVATTGRHGIVDMLHLR
jgi:SAM-dependent methyltransferase